MATGNVTSGSSTNETEKMGPVNSNRDQGKAWTEMNNDTTVTAIATQWEICTDTIFGTITVWANVQLRNRFRAANH
jgi:hypothetical protein